MTDFSYGDIIEYIDCTFDVQFEEAKHWCEQYDAQLIELVERRKEKGGLLYRYFEIRENPKPVPTPEEIKQMRIAELKMFLADTDYAVIKIAEGAATKEEYADLIAQRQAWRAEINELEGQ